MGIARDVHQSVAKHVGTQPDCDCAGVRYQAFERPSRQEMSDLQAAWIVEVGDLPIGNMDENTTWAKPPLMGEE